jgi:hypothetical protein
MEENRKCISCGKQLTGRIDKKFCDPFCKSSYHYRKDRMDTHAFYYRVEKQLKINRRILKAYNKAGKSTVRSEVLIKEGFNPNFFTHYWKSGKGDVYLFVFEFGFLRKKENGRDKFVLVIWQNYMDNHFVSG